MVKLELYRVFREVAEAGNISLAAENLYLSQSAVSQSGKQLEQQLGTRLFLRSPRGVCSITYGTRAESNLAIIRISISLLRTKLVLDKRTVPACYALAGTVRSNRIIGL